MIKVLFIAHVDSYYAAFADLAARLCALPGFAPAFLFPRHYPNVKKHMAACAAVGIAYRAGFDTDTTESRPPGLIRRLVMALARRLPGVWYLIHYRALKGRLRAIRWELEDLSPGVILLGGDIVGHDMALYIKAGHDLGIGSVILPGWMASAREPAELQLYNPAFSLERPLNWLFCRRYPHWHFRHKGRDLIRLPAQEALALEHLGLAPPLPWVLHSGYADVIAVESIEAREYGVREGLDPARLRIVGSSTHDALHVGKIERVARRQELCARVGIDPEQPLVVCALPPDMLYVTGGRPDCEFTDYLALVAGFLEPISRILGGRFLVCPHPSADRTRLNFAFDNGAILAEEPVAELLPLADLYVASISATIQWAIACGIPVINYDVYRYRYTDYVGLAGVLPAETPEEYMVHLSKMIQDSDFRFARSKDQQEVSHRWGGLDGRATERICTLLEEYSKPFPNTNK